MTDRSDPQSVSPEVSLARFIVDFDIADLPDSDLTIVKYLFQTALSTGMAGATEEGVPQLLSYLRQTGGREEATVLVHGGKVPASKAALVNGLMCRALDYCDAIAPGQHIGSSLIPAALAAAELRGGCNGQEFLSALAIGAEIAIRLNLSEMQYDGFDPTGVTAVFASTAAAARLLSLNEDQTRSALGLAFNRCGGSFQSNIDGSLAVRFIQGWVAEAGVECARLAALGITGPGRFISGDYGYAHLFARDKAQASKFTTGLNQLFHLDRLMFKKYPSCGLTQGVTHLSLEALHAMKFQGEELERIEVSVPPYAHRLVGHDFKLGSNPRVNAQFSLQYCVASAVFRGSSRLTHFEEPEIRHPQVQPLIEKISVNAVPGMNERGHTAVDLKVSLKDGQTRTFSIDDVPGFPARPLTGVEHRTRFFDCITYATRDRDNGDVVGLYERLQTIECSPDVREIFPLIRQAWGSGLSDIA